MVEPISPQAARREQIQSEHRPSAQMDIKELVKATETQDTFKIYVKEFHHYFTGTLEQCQAEFKSRYEGRLHDGDWRIRPPFDGSVLLWLELSTWNVRGEFKTESYASEFAEQIDDSSDNLYQIVGRNSRAEVELKDYGVKKLIGRARDVKATPTPEPSNP